MDHIVQGHWAGSIKNLDALNRSPLGNVPRSTSRLDLNGGIDFFLGFAMSACQPIFTLFSMPANTGIEQFARWTAVSALLPVGMGMILCFVVAQIWRILAAS